MSEPDFVKFQHDEYWMQTKGVLNFLRATDARARIEQTLAQNEAALEENVQTFLQAILGSRKRTAIGISIAVDDKLVVNPYRNLNYYGLFDKDLPGRETLSTHIAGDIQKLFALSERPTLIRLTGPSGCGKTSLMRSGILRRLREAGGYRIVCLRPEQLMGTAPLSLLYTALIEEAKLVVSASALRNVLMEDPRAGEILALAVSEALRMEGSNDRLVLGLDQFEEIVDRCSGQTGREWQPLLDFVRQASTTPNIGIVYTLESSRISFHQRLGAAFVEAPEYDVPHDASIFLPVVIHDPFERTGSFSEGRS